jgi:FAD/FMN-containing dehydrogenase
MSEAQNKFKELEEKLGPGKVYLDRAIRITHRMAHTPEILLHKDRIDDFLPDAVVYVTSTDDVVEVVKFANRYKKHCRVTGKKGRNCG